MMTSLIPAASRARPRGSAEALLHVPRVMIRELFLVLGDLPIELVGEVVDRGVHVAVRRLGMDRGTAACVHRRLRLVNELLDGQNAVDGRHVVEVALELSEPRRDVVAQRVRDFDVMTGNRQIHGSLLVVHVSSAGSGEARPRRSPRLRGCRLNLRAYSASGRSTTGCSALPGTWRWFAERP